MTALVVAPGRSGIDTERWPDVAVVPPESWRTPFARALVRRALHRLPLTGDAVMVCHNAELLARRVAANGMIGFGESYMAGEWDAPDLAAVLGVFASHFDELVPSWSRWLRRWVLPAANGRDLNTPGGARSNIAHHYDLSNDLFAAFLDETMTYSSAQFEPGERRDRANLATAQRRKIDRLLDECRVGSGTRLLEIGSGWGELAIRAAQRGAEVVTITLSQEQRELAVARVRAAGLDEGVDVRLVDYRDVDGSFDAIVSVEMIEAVGAEYWADYFGQLDTLLATGGLVGIQTITKPHHRMVEERRTYSWINKYIFPGGLVPSFEAIESTVGETTRLRVVDRIAFGQSYADTLAIWRQRFDDRASDVAALGFDDVFRRMWDFYLACSEAGFRAGLLDVEQLIMRRDD